MGHNSANFFTLTFPKVKNENYFLLAALRRKSDSPKEPDPCGSDSEVTVPRVLAVADYCSKLAKGLTQGGSG